MLKSIALLSWFTPFLASAVVGEGCGVSVWAGRKKKDTQKDGQGAIGMLLLCQDKSNGTRALQEPSPGAKPCRNPHLACQGGAGLTASCSHQQTSGRWEEGCFFSSHSDGDASSVGLLELLPARARQTPWTGLAGPGSYLGMAKGNEAVRAETPPGPKPRSPRGKAVPRRIP